MITELLLRIVDFANLHLKLSVDLIKLKKKTNP